jgi:Domain of unknown function (DUF4113)
MPGLHVQESGHDLYRACARRQVQSGLFYQPDDERSTSGMAAIDALNRRFGRGTIGFARRG